MYTEIVTVFTSLLQGISSCRSNYNGTYHPERVSVLPQDVECYVQFGRSCHGDAAMDAT